MEYKFKNVINGWIYIIIVDSLNEAIKKLNLITGFKVNYEVINDAKY